MSDAWAATVTTHDGDVYGGVTRLDAIGDAVGVIADDIVSGYADAGELDVEVYEAPEWHARCPDDVIEGCEYCGALEEHHDQTLIGWASRETVAVRVYWTAPDAEDSDIEWEEVTDE